VKKILGKIGNNSSLPLARFQSFAKRVLGVPRAPGDVNGNGAVNVADALRVLDMLTSAEPMPKPGSESFAAADVNRDSKVDVTDARLILQYALGITSKL